MIRDLQNFKLSTGNTKQTPVCAVVPGLVYCYKQYVPGTDITSAVDSPLTKHSC